MKRYITFLSFATICFIAIVAVFGLSFGRQNQVAASIVTGESYNSTSTPFGAQLATTTLIKKGSIQLGSVIITGVNTGVFYLYDATTSDITQRAASLASSSILVTSFPANAATGTYQYDVTLQYGLLYSGTTNVATSTITYK